MPRGRPKTINGGWWVGYFDNDVRGKIRRNKEAKKFRSDNESARDLLGIGTKKSKKIFGGKDR